MTSISFLASCLFGLCPTSSTQFEMGTRFLRSSKFWPMRVPRITLRNSWTFFHLTRFAIRHLTAQLLRNCKRNAIRLTKKWDLRAPNSYYRPTNFKRTLSSKSFSNFGVMLCWVRSSFFLCRHPSAVLSIVLGKFSQWNEKIKYFILQNQSELDKLSLDPDYEIVEVVPIGEILQVGAKPSSAFTSPSMNSQLVVGSYVTGNITPL